MLRGSVRLTGAGIAAILLANGCGSRTAPAAPTITPGTSVATPPPVQPSPPHAYNWLGDATVLSRAGDGACGWGTSQGETRTGVKFDISISADGGQVELIEDTPNWPTDEVDLRGALTGPSFAAFDQWADPAAPAQHYVCDFRRADMTGAFSADFMTFEATETLIWGPPTNRATVVRHWTAAKIQ